MATGYTLNHTLAVLLGAGAGVVGGVFFAFSSFVMKALAQLPASQGVAAMQRINVVVVNLWFMAAFLGTAALSVAVCALAWWAGEAAPHAWPLWRAALFYLVGTLLVTVAINVPMNDRLARMEISSPQAAAYWPEYLRRWGFWNHVRGVAAMAACVMAMLSLLD
jgi:uncharacterized membrane protein